MYTYIYIYIVCLYICTSAGVDKISKCASQATLESLKYESCKNEIKININEHKIYNKNK